MVDLFIYQPAYAFSLAEVQVIDEDGDNVAPATRGTGITVSSVADAYAGDNVQFVGVLYQDSEAAGLRFLDELGSSPHFEYVVDAESRSAIRYGVYGIPETFVVGADGVIVHKILGPVVDPTQLTAPIEEALAGSS